jgi:hypothetical protein
VVSAGADGRGNGKRGAVRLTATQQALVERHLALVGLHLKRRVRLPRTATRDREAEDLFQEGCIGLIRAAMTYDPAVHGAFGAYALARIRWAVHLAMHGTFDTVCAPYRVRARSTGRNGDAGAERPRCVSNGWRALRTATSDGRTDTAPERGSLCEAVADHVREKYRLAVGAAVDRVAGRCRRSDIRPVLEAIVSERLTVPRAEARTPLRAIARRFSVPVSRATAWERSLQEEAAAGLHDDPEIRRLRSVCVDGGEEDDPDIARRLGTELASRRAAAFAAALAARDVNGQARLLWSVAARTGADPTRHAAALFASLGTAEQREVLAACAR